MRKKGKRVVAALCMLCSALMMFSGMGITALAAWTAISSTTNYISTPDFGIETLEVYDPPEHGLSPGVEVEKKVTVTNQGTVNALVRVQLTTLLGQRDDNGELIVNEALDPNQIILSLNDSEWTFDESDGWFYYNKQLAPGAETEPVLYSFHLHPEASEEYKGRDCQIVVDAESLQATEDALSVWNKNASTFPVDLTPEEQEQLVTQILFLDPMKKFDIETTKADLFLNFKDVLPGESRSQTIVVGNEYSEDVSIRLTLMEKGAEASDTESLLYEFLENYVTVKVTNVDGEVVHEGPVASDGTCDIPFGSFAPKEAKQLTVELDVSPEMTKDYAGLMADVEWEVQADEIAKEPLAQTSDYSLWKLGIALLIAGIVGINLSKLMKKEKGEKNVHAV